MDFFTQKSEDWKHQILSEFSAQFGKENTDFYAWDGLKCELVDFLIPYGKEVSLLYQAEKKIRLFGISITLKKVKLEVNLQLSEHTRSMLVVMLRNKAGLRELVLNYRPLASTEQLPGSALLGIRG